MLHFRPLRRPLRTRAERRSAGRVVESLGDRGSDQQGQATQPRRRLKPAVPVAPKRVGPTVPTADNPTQTTATKNHPIRNSPMGLPKLRSVTLSTTVLHLLPPPLRLIRRGEGGAPRAWKRHSSSCLSQRRGWDGPQQLPPSLA